MKKGAIFLLQRKRLVLSSPQQSRQASGREVMLNSGGFLFSLGNGGAR
jgi:hypothetical protein